MVAPLNDLPSLVHLGTDNHVIYYNLENGMISQFQSWQWNFVHSIHPYLLQSHWCAYENPQIDGAICTLAPL